jgi:hypothetical protein
MLSSLAMFRTFIRNGLFSEKNLATPNLFCLLSVKNHKRVFNFQLDI